MSHLQYCDKVEKCQHENEVCFVQRYTRTFSENFYNSGCIGAQYCNRSGISDGCLQCCEGNFCNSAGCGDNGFQALSKRGPVCFDCNHLGENDICKTVQLCHADQSCVIEKFAWGENFHFLMGCADSQVCSHLQKRDLATRNAPVCAHCCQSEFCNMNCSVTNTGPTLVNKLDNSNRRWEIKYCV